MQLISEFVISGYYGPREKPYYQGSIGETKLRPFLLAEDFQDEIKNQLKLCLMEHQYSSRFPISTGASLSIELYTNEDKKLFGVLKNILDACIGSLISDDRAVNSLVIRKYPSSQQHDIIHLDLLSGKALKDFDTSNLDPYMVFTLDIDTVSEDRYLPYPPSSAISVIENPNDLNDERIRLQMERAYNSSPLNGSLAISVVMDLQSNDCDIDNLSLNYLINMESVVFNHFNQVDALHLKVTQSNTPNLSNIKVYTIGNIF